MTTVPPSLSAGRIAGAVATVAAVLLLNAGVAAAHVGVDPTSVPKGAESQVLSFRVPNEKDGASTVGVTVKFPQDHPIGFVTVEPVPGWTVQATKVAPTKKVEIEGIEVDQVVNEVTWTGGEIQPGQFQEFTVSAGPLPTDTDQLVFDVEQTYSDGTTVSWDEPTPPSGEEPEHPAPTLQLTPEEADGHSNAATAAKVTAVAATKSDVDAANQRGTIGLAVAAVAAVLALIALIAALRKRSTPHDATS